MTKQDSVGGPPTRIASGRRVGILVRSLFGGGTERVSLAVAHGLILRGYKVDFLLRDLVCDYPKESLPRARLFFVRVKAWERPKDLPDAHPMAPGRLPMRLRFPRFSLAPRLGPGQMPRLATSWFPRWSAAVAAYLDRERPDAVLTQGTGPTAVLMAAGHLAVHRARTVAALHGGISSGRRRRRAERVYVRADAVVGVSAGTAADLAGLPGMARERVHMVYNPVVTEEMERKAREPVDHPWIGETGPPVILAAGRLHALKDFPTLLAAFARLLAWRPARLIVLGKGKQRPHLLSLARRLGVAENIDFPGFVDNPYAFMARASLFVLSSRRGEGLPTVLIEAMACGCPVVSTDCPYGPREILEDGKHGPLVPVGDAEALAAAMARTLDAPPRPEALRERASFFNAARAIDRYEELLIG